MTCPHCGETLAGDGWSEALHCPNIYVGDMCLEPDANPVYCEVEDELRE